MAAQSVCPGLSRIAAMTGSDSLPRSVTILAPMRVQPGGFHRLDRAQQHVIVMGPYSTDILQAVGGLDEPVMTRRPPSAVKLPVSERMIRMPGNCAMTAAKPALRLIVGAEPGEPCNSTREHRPRLA